MLTLSLLFLTYTTRNLGYLTVWFQKDPCLQPTVEVFEGGPKFLSAFLDRNLEGEDPFLQRLL